MNKQDSTTPRIGPRAAAAVAPHVTFTSDGRLAIRDMVITDDDVVAEASRWANGKRGEPVLPQALAGKELDGYVLASLSLSARMLSYAGDASGVGELAARVAQLTDRAETAGQALIKSAADAATQTAAVTRKATDDAAAVTARTVSAAMERFEKDTSSSLSASMTLVDQKLEGLFRGEHSTVASNVRQIITTAMTQAQATWNANATAAMLEIQKVFDASNPSNPIAGIQKQIESTAVRQHGEITAKLDQVQLMVASAVGAATQAAALADAVAHSPMKGLPYEQATAEALAAIAAGMGASYERTGHIHGLVRNSKKGDAVIELAGTADGEPALRILIEVTTQVSARDWTPYLREAERNRGCQVSIGLVPSARQVPGGGPIALIGAKRAVFAFNPAADDPCFLRVVIQLLAVEARRQAATARGSDLGVADSKLVAARAQLGEMVALHKTAVSVRDNAGKVATGLDALRVSMTQTLDQALASLRGAASSEVAA